LNHPVILGEEHKLQLSHHVIFSIFLASNILDILFSATTLILYSSFKQRDNAPHALEKADNCTVFLQILRGQAKGYLLNEWKHFLNLMYSNLIMHIILSFYCHLQMLY
jgi:hypothetical protein